MANTIRAARYASKMRWGVLLIVAGCAGHESAAPTVTSTPAASAPSAVVAQTDEPSPFEYVAHPEHDDVVAREYAVVDAQLRKDFDYDSGKLRFTWVINATALPPVEFPVEVVSTAVDTAEHHASTLARLIAQQPSPRWVVTLLAREASVYESVWLALKDMPPMLSPAQQATLRQQRQAALPPTDLAMIDDFAERTRSMAMLKAARGVVGTYAWALAFARASHVSALQDDVRTRLTVFRQLLGNKTFEHMVTTAPPPRGVGRASAWLTLMQVGDL